MRVEFSETSLKSLEQLREFYIRRIGVESADLIVDNIFKKTEILENFPELGGLELSQLSKGLKIRYLIEGHCKILYDINSKSNVIEIIEVFDTRQSPDKMLSKD